MAYKKRSPEHSQFGTLRAYFTEGDPFVQYNHHSKPSSKRLAKKLKVLALLNDSITVAGAHVLESNVTWKLLRNHPMLLEQGIVVPAINADFDSFEDMVDRKLNSDSLSRPSSPMETLDEETLYQRARLLEDRATAVMGWDINQMRGDFRQALYNALSASESPFYQTVSETVSPEDLKTRIESRDIISRNTIQDEISDLPPTTQQLIMGYVNANYHLVGATTHKAVPNVHRQELPRFEYLFQQGVELDKEILDEKSSRINYAPIDESSMFVEFLKAIDTDTKTLQILDIEETIALRNKPITDNFRRELYNAMQDVQSRTVSDVQFQFNEVRNEFREEINKRIESEKTKRKYANKTQNLIRTSLYAASVGSLVTHPELSAGLTITNPVIQKLVEKLPDLVGNEFMTFNQHYQSVIAENN